MVSLASPYYMEMAMERGGGGNLEDGVALQLALELSRLNVNSSDSSLPPPPLSGIPIVNGASGNVSGTDTMYDGTTECVAVPSSEHVAEIVGRQG